jgi:predicted metal-dependent hydrolase
MAPKYLLGYSADTMTQVAQLIASSGLGHWLLKKYPNSHGIRTDKALYDYTLELKQSYLRGAEPLAKVCFDSKLHVVQHALGTHTAVSRVQGSRLKSKREIRIAALFKEVPPEFLRMITVHELAHLKERAHDKAFYQLCSYMEPNYHQLEFELRLYLTYIEETGTRLWGPEALARRSTKELLTLFNVPPAHACGTFV